MVEDHLTCTLHPPLPGSPVHYILSCLSHLYVTSSPACLTYTLHPPLPVSPVHYILSCLAHLYVTSPCLANHIISSHVWLTCTLYPPSPAHLYTTSPLPGSTVHYIPPTRLTCTLHPPSLAYLYSILLDDWVTRTCCLVNHVGFTFHSTFANATPSGGRS